MASLADLQKWREALFEARMMNRTLGPGPALKDTLYLPPGVTGDDLYGSAAYKEHAGTVLSRAVSRCIALRRFLRGCCKCLIVVYTC